jgi:hypothetical protein
MISGVREKSIDAGLRLVVAENRFIVGIVNRKERFGTAQFVAHTGVTSQEFIQFAPWHNYDRFGNARAAASSFAFGAGGFSSKLRTRKLSLSESCTRSALSMTALAAR